MESGFEQEDVSSLGEGSSPATAASKRTAIAFADELTAAKKQRTQVGAALEQVVGLLGDRQPKKMDNCIQKVADYSQMMRDDDALDAMSPTSRDLCVSELKSERKGILQKMKDEDGSDSNAD